MPFTMARPLSPYEARMYDASRLLVRRRMAGTDWYGRISAREVYETCREAGFDVSLSAVRKVLSGELVSRPLLRIVSGAVLQLRERRRAQVPDF